MWQIKRDIKDVNRLSRMCIGVNVNGLGMDEELIGGQKKLDLNKNGRLDKEEREKMTPEDKAKLPPPPDRKKKQ